MVLIFLKINDLAKAISKALYSPRAKARGN